VFATPTTSTRIRERRKSGKLKRIVEACKRSTHHRRTSTHINETQTQDDDDSERELCESMAKMPLSCFK
jgi:hypothetical protein